MSGASPTDDDKIAAWASRQASGAVSRAELSSSESFARFDWDARRSAAAAMACEAVQAGLAELSRAGAVSAAPEPRFDEEGYEQRKRGDKVGHVWGFLVLGSTRRGFWPVDRRVNPWDNYENFAPSMKGPGVAEHWGMRAITALAGRAAMALIARRAALDLIEGWVRDELSRPGPEGWGPHLRAAWEREQIGSESPEALKKNTRARSL